MNVVPIEPRRVVGILVVYYEKYLNNALAQFGALLNSIDKNHLIVVINNNHCIKNIATSSNLIVLDGDNSLREFSAWDAGYLYCTNNNILKNDGVLVFANDTFCHHNKFGIVTRTAFALKFRELLRKSSNPILAGEIHNFGEDFQVFGKSAKSWVSTYLFCMTFSLAQRVKKLTPSVNLNDLFTSNNSDDFIFGNLSSNLIKHIQRWLLNPNGASHWYGSGTLTTENRPAYIGKAKSIICEKYLSAAVIDSGGQLASVFGNCFLRNARRLEKIFPNDPGST